MTFDFYFLVITKKYAPQNILNHLGQQESEKFYN